MTVIDEIAAERRRQIEAEGWTPEHDDEHDRGQMAMAAASYAVQAASDVEPNYNLSSAHRDKIPALWPWGAHWWKPKTGRRDLVRAAALLVAEIERLDRINAPGDGEKTMGDW